MKKLLLPFVTLLFVACATQPSTQIPQSFSAESSEGMIVGTIAFKNEKPIFNGYTFFYSGPNKRNYIKINPEQTIKMKFKPNFYDDDKAVYFFSVSGTPGNYRFTDLQFFANGGYMTSTRTLPIDIDFKIEKGKVKYMGEIYVNYNQRLIQQSDKKERDLPKLKETFPSLTVE